MNELKERSNQTLSDAIRIALMIALKNKRETLSYLLEMAMLEADDVDQTDNPRNSRAG